MDFKYRNISFVSYILIFAFCFACNSKPSAPVMFEVLDNSRTGLNFSNNLSGSDSFNMFKYMYFYNGAGIAAGDFNNDGKIDLFFSANQGNSTLYLNTGNLHFKDVTAEARIPKENAWNTGVSIADINNDGLLDIYICRVGKYQVLNSRNELLICTGINKNGVPQFVNKAHEYGLDFSGFSTHAAFFDYDLDGDLDMFLLNHSVHENGSFRPRQDFLGTYHELSGDRMYRNDSDHFTDVTHASMINSSSISYGLGVVVTDINLDGYPDLYVGNDFHENDYLYINQKNGTFKEQVSDEMMHTSQYTMGVDAADVNNDGFPEIISVDMLPSDPAMVKRSPGEGDYDIFYGKIGYGYNYQYSRNNFQYNRRNGMFSEIGLYSGIAATDWSWAPLWMDFDNDGVKDLFIANGIPKRLNDIDFINFVSDQEVQQKIQDNKINETDATLIDKFPKIKLPNKFFKNAGELKFKDIGQSIKNDKATYSNGAIYADFDNDGDLDIVVNNIDEPALLYENKAGATVAKSSLQLTLHGDTKNINAVGAKVIVYANKGIRLYEKFPVHGFLSSMETPVHIGLDKTVIDSIFLVWPDNTYQPVFISKNTVALQLKYQKNLPVFDYSRITSFKKSVSIPVENIADAAGLYYKHEENSFNEFDREPLIPHMLSTEGPALAVADINHDGTEDFFIGSARGKKSAVFIQNKKGKFIKQSVPALDNDSAYEDISAIWADVNNDGNTDLVIAAGGNEYFGKNKYMTPRIYLNDGKAHFSLSDNAFGNLFVNASAITTCDFNSDGYIDLFVGARSVPYNYGIVPQSYLLLNDKAGRFKDVTSLYAKELSDIGFVTDSKWVDIDKDGDKDLILSLEWGGIVAFMNNRGIFTKQLITDKKGWWNFTTPCDIDNDGDIDFIAGNLGQNSRLKASPQEEVKLYYNDFDGNGIQEQVLTYYLSGREIPFASKAELERQMPFLKKKYLYAKDFANASLDDMFNKQKLSQATMFSANYFSNAVLINDGKMHFEVQALPWEAQFTSYRDAVVTDANGDNLPDILLAGNYYDNNIEMGRYDADFGTILINKGHGRFSAEGLNGVQLKGQSRHIMEISVGKRIAYIVAKNNDSVMLISGYQRALEKK